MYEKLDPEKEAWSLEIGFYPGVLFGFRSYIEEDLVIHALYLPFVDLALTVFK